jgi:alpha-glucosidase
MQQLPDWLDTIYHSGAFPYVSDLFPKLGDTVTIQVRVGQNAPIKRLFLRTFPDGEQHFAPMQRAESGYYAAALKIAEPVVHYRIVLESADGLFWLTAKGAQLHEPLDTFDFRIIADYHAPNWLHATVFYQIFPDRFANGDPANDIQPEDFEYRGQRPRTFGWEEPPDSDTIFPLVFYGGDLIGVRQRLDHIENLGINAIYFNPLFTSKSNHKYDGSDYDHVDPTLGGDGALESLREELTRRNMRYMLDIVPNHCGFSHPWFQKAQADRTALEAEFFTFSKHPNQYATWLGVWSLPKLNYNSVELRRRMYGNADGILRKWLVGGFSADGWRVDVANMLGRQGETQIGDEVSQEIRAAVKGTRPNAYLLGENFFDATSQLQGDQYDGAMNYAGFTHPLLYWLIGFHLRAWGLGEEIWSDVPFSTEALIDTWRERMAVIPWQIQLQQFNLLGSHDTPRIRSLVNGDDARHRLAVAVLLTFPGVPSIYYGDEIGMVDDPHLRQRGCMIWDEDRWNVDLLAFYRELITLRRASSALQVGSFQIVGAANDWFAYLRQSETDTILLIANRGDALANFALPLQTTNLEDGTQLTVIGRQQTITVKDRSIRLAELPNGALILRTINTRS